MSKKSKEREEYLDKLFEEVDTESDNFDIRLGVITEENADYSDYLDRPSWTLYESVCLLIDAHIEQNKEKRGEEKWGYEKGRIFTEYEGKLDAEVGANTIPFNNYKGECYFSKDTIIKWAISKNVPLPKELNEYLLKSENTSEQIKQKILTRKSSQVQREEVLGSYLKQNNHDSSKPIQISQNELWNELSKQDSTNFPPLSDDSIRTFFKKQNLCSFKKGRKN